MPSRNESRRPDFDRILPLKPVVFHILLALAEEPSHGYGVIQTVRRQSEGWIPLPTGAFYRHLRRLIDDGWVATVSGPRGEDDPRRGTYYALTTLGREVLRADWRRMADLVAATKRQVDAAVRR
ncbi:MAG: PadR family transcriptional regulator [Gemmatimonadales bacterium]